MKPFYSDLLNKWNNVKIWAELFHKKNALTGSFFTKIASTSYRRLPRWKPSFRKVRGCRHAT